MTSPAHPIPDFSALVEVVPADGPPPGDPAEVLAAILVEHWRKKQARLAAQQAGDQEGGGISETQNRKDGDHDCRSKIEVE